MLKKKQQREEEQQRALNDYSRPDEYEILKKKTIKELIAPSGIDATNIDHLEIISNVTRYARSLFLHYQECVPSQSYLETCTYLEI